MRHILTEAPDVFVRMQTAYHRDCFSFALGQLLFCCTTTTPQTKIGQNPWPALCLYHNILISSGWIQRSQDLNRQPFITYISFVFPQGYYYVVILIPTTPIYYYRLQPIYSLHPHYNYCQLLFVETFLLKDICVLPLRMLLCT